MELTYDQKKAFYEDGYIIVRGGVPGIMVERARRAINHHMSQNMIQQGRNPGLSDQAVITDLFNQTPISPMCESIVGEENLQFPKAGNVKLNFPGAEDRELVRGHLDLGGKLRQGLLSRGFTLLVVVLVHDVPRPYMGNFTFWPGAHKVFEKAFQADPNYPETLRQNRQLPDVDLPHEPIQFTGKAGDVAICHHQMYHNAAPNNSPDIRYAVIFRPRHGNAGENSTDAMADIWREFGGLEDVREEWEAVNAD